VYTHIFSCLKSSQESMRVAKSDNCTAKTKYWKLETNIPRRGIARHKSQFPHSCVCQRFIYSIPTIGLPILLQENCGPILDIYKSLTDTWVWKLGLKQRNSFSGSTLEFSLQCDLDVFFLQSSF
jgi:hypothetical protein